jgi:phosphoenolpyruvate carboxykinase (ATP)
MKLNTPVYAIAAALNGELDNVAYRDHVVFYQVIPQECPKRTERDTKPKKHMEDKDLYDQKQSN